MSNRLTFLATVAGVAAMAASAHAATVYSNNFSKNADDFSGVTSTTTSPSGETFLGPLYNGGGGVSTDTTTLTLKTAGYTGLTVSFDLYVIGSMDGDGQYGGGPDPFLVSDNGGDVFNYNFANYSGDTQNYPNPSSQPDTGAIAVGKLGYSGFPGNANMQDSIYAVTINLADASTTAISFVGDTSEGVSNEFYGIDNVTVSGTPSAVSATPEPASWALMIAGVGLIGLTFRHSRREMAAISA